MNIFREVLWPLLAVILAFAVGGVIILLLGDDPINAYAWLLSSSFGSIRDIGWTLHYATPLIFTGLAVAVAFRRGLLNIGAEGQLYIAAFATAWVGITLGGTSVAGESWAWTSLPGFLLVPLCVLAAVLVGGFWGAIPGFLKARFGSHEVINTIMLNFIAIALVSYLTQYHYKNPGPILETPPIGEAATIPRLNEIFGFISPDVPLNIAFFIALLMCVLVYVFLWKTKWGYELRAVGENPSAAEYGGISPKKQIVLAMTISERLGMVAVGEVMGTLQLLPRLFGNGVFSVLRSPCSDAIIRLVFYRGDLFGVLLRGGDLRRCVHKICFKGSWFCPAGDHDPFVACFQRYTRR